MSLQFQRREIQIAFTGCCFKITSMISFNSFYKLLWFIIMMEYWEIYLLFYCWERKNNYSKWSKTLIYCLIYLTWLRLHSKKHSNVKRNKFQWKKISSGKTAKKTLFNSFLNTKCWLCSNSHRLVLLISVTNFWKNP